MRWFDARPDDDRSLVESLWDLGTWADEARTIHEVLTDPADPARQFAAAAAAVRHLLTDPILPASLEPADWPADELRKAYFQCTAFMSRLTSEKEPT